MKRVYAYEHEDFIYSLFAPLALYDDYEKKWILPPAIRTSEGVRGNIVKLPEEYIIHRISVQYNLTEEDALNRLKEFVTKGLLHHNDLGHWCELGITLDLYPNIISDNDMNLSKWIEKYGKPVTKEQRLAEAEPYNYISPNSNNEADDRFGI